MVCVPWWHRGGSFLLFSFAVFKATDPCCEICPSWNPSSLFGHLISSIDPLLCLYEVSCNVMLLDFFTTVVLALWLPQPTRLAGSTWLFVYLNKFFLYSTGSPCCKAEVVRGGKDIDAAWNCGSKEDCRFLTWLSQGTKLCFYSISTESAPFGSTDIWDTVNSKVGWFHAKSVAPPSWILTISCCF